MRLRHLPGAAGTMTARRREEPATASATSITAAPRIARPYCARRYGAVIMPAPTVSFVASSMRMNEPVKRLRA